MYETCLPNCAKHPPKYTKVERIFDGLDETPNPSEKGLQYFLAAATARSEPSSPSRLHRLPLEIQDMISRERLDRWTYAYLCVHWLLIGVRQPVSLARMAWFY